IEARPSFKTLSTSALALSFASWESPGSASIAFFVSSAFVSKSDLDKKSEDAKKEIDKLPNLTDDEKQKAKDDIDQKNQERK
ncbi:GA module-containing protein, partial [Erysipelothrix rhusiopathiae]|nr:GA module-containing protein [Erysipelothrix rhusiopathiae]